MRHGQKENAHVGVVTTLPLRERARYVASRCWEGLVRGDAFQAAAAVAFWFFLSLVPLLVLTGFLIGQVARARGVDALVIELLDFAPATAVDLVRKELERLAGGSTSVAPLGVAGFVWTASSGLHNLMDVVEQAAKSKPRLWWKQRALSVGCVALALAAVCLAAWVLVRIGSATPTPTQAYPAPAAAEHGSPSLKGIHSAAPSRHRARYVLRSAADKGLAATVVLVLGVGLLAGFYRAAVERSPRDRPRQIWPGTCFAVGSWLVVSWAFGGYVASLGNYALYYGSLAAVAVTLMWLYLTSLSLVVGAYVNAAISSSYP
jgi:membrane protein